jgi:hypothetical protein
VVIEDIRPIFDRNDAKSLRVIKPFNECAVHGAILPYTGTLNVSNWRMGWKTKIFSFRAKLPGWIRGGLIECAKPNTGLAQ